MVSTFDAEEVKEFESTSGFSEGCLCSFGVPGFIAREAPLPPCSLASAGDRTHSPQMTTDDHDLSTFLSWQALAQNTYLLQMANSARENHRPAWEAGHVCLLRPNVSEKGTRLKCVTG